MASTNFTNSVTLTDADWFDDVDTEAYSYLTGVAGTNTITANGPASLEAYAAGLEFEFIPANTNTGATTINITGASALGARNIFSNGAACVGGELRQNVPVKIIDDGTRFHILSNAVPVPFVDTYPVVVGSADSTKKVRFEVDGLTTATTRVVTVPDSDFTIATAGANSNITSLTGLTTPLTVAQGGQGNAVLTPYAVLCGGITSTAAAQSIAGIGTSGQVLTSNGAGALPTFQATGVAVGSVVQVVNSQTGAVATGTTIIPWDDTIPQNTEGDQYMSLAITPSSTTNKLRIDVVMNLAGSISERRVMALFQDTTAGALAAVGKYNSNGDAAEQLVLTHYMTAGTTSATTFKVRAGMAAAGTTTFNGEATNRKLGTAMASSITITEIKA